MLLTFSRKSINEVPAVESTESTTEGQNSTTDEDTNHVTNNNTHETRPVPMFEALKQPEHIDRWNTHTPEVAAEVADSAALLDLPTPEPEASDELVDDTEAELPLAISDIAEKAAEADIAAEVADTAETLDADEASQIQLELLALMRIDILHRTRLDRRQNRRLQPLHRILQTLLQKSPILPKPWTLMR